ncbi:hypothetical protein BD410DRAFT_684353, partial [Rickenella mellea]
TGILLVSAFYPITTSRHPLRDYTEQLTNFLSSIHTDIYFYTTSDFEPTIRRARGSLPITINTTFSSPFEIPPLNSTRESYEAFRKGRNFALATVDGVRAGSPHFLAEAVRTVQSQQKDYKYAFWIDADDFSTKHRYGAWPDMARVEKLWEEEGRRETGMRPEQLMFFQIRGLPHVSMLLWKEAMGPIVNQFSQASFFGGQIQAISWWEKYFYAYHDYYLREESYTGHVEPLINSLFIMHPERIITVWSGDPDAPASDGVHLSKNIGRLGDCGDDETYHQFWLANEKERDQMRALWDSRWVWRWSFWRSR